MRDLREHLPKPADTVTYEIVLRGHLDDRWAARLGVPSLTHEQNGTTVLREIAVDQAALHGLLQRVRDLSLTLVSVARIEAVAAFLSTRPSTPGDQK